MAVYGGRSLAWSMRAVMIWILPLCSMVVIGGAAPASHALALLGYVANGGNNHIQVLDLTSGKTLRKLYAGVAPWRLQLSPNGEYLWVQHWYSATTAVIDLHDHEIVRVLPIRGPGIFSPTGDRFLSFNWPSSTLHEIDAQALTHLAQHVIEVPQVYDLSFTSDRSRLAMVQFNPMAQGAQERYGYLISYPFGERVPSLAVPASHSTGASPARITQPSGQPFILTADRETNRLSLFNTLWDRRTVPTCVAPQSVVLSPDHTRMIVLCWESGGKRYSHIVTYRTDFTVRPWPRIIQEATMTVTGGLVAGQFTPSGQSLYVVDQTEKRLLEVDPMTLRIHRSFPTGDVPMDVKLVAVAPSVRDRLATQASRSRRLLKQVLTQMQQKSQSFTDLSWTAIATTLAETKAAQRPVHGDTPGPRHLRLTYALKPPNQLRIESEGQRVRLAQGGTMLSIDPQGRFWTAPRQELLSVLYGLANMSVEEALRQLAGDVPGSPFLRSGIAIDLVREVREGHHRYYVIGAMTPGIPVAQLWIDAHTGYPTNLVEQFPIFQSQGHQSHERRGLVETKFYDFTFVHEHYLMPMRLERIVDGRWTQQVRVEEVQVNSVIADRHFDLSRLGGMGPQPSRDLISPVPTHAEAGQPGWTVPSLGHVRLHHPMAPHTSYNSSPPTSGPYLPFPARWGKHTVPVPLALQVHNLARGGVAIQYNCPQTCPDLVTKLERIVKRYDHLLLAPYPLMDAPIALTAWGRMVTLREYDETRIVRFVEAYTGQDHTLSRRQEYR